MLGKVPVGRVEGNAGRTTREEEEAIEWGAGEGQRCVHITTACFKCLKCSRRAVGTLSSSRHVVKESSEMKACPPQEGEGREATQAKEGSRK